MALHIQLVSMDVIDSRPCIAISCHSQRFLFDICEGTQRLCVEHKVRLARISAVFVTSADYSRYLGLPGFCLTAMDSGNTGFRIVASEQVQKFMHATRYFMRLPTGFINFSTEATHDFGDIIIEAIGFSCREGVTNVASATHVCYIGISTRAKGKFDVQKAAALNVPRGPLFGQLKNGHAVTLSDGSVVRPEQVLDEPEPSKAFIIVPAIETVDAINGLEKLVQHPSLHRFFASTSGDDGMKSESIVQLEFMVHLSPVDSISDQRYQQWMQLFPATMKHIFVGKGACIEESAYVAATRYCDKLHDVLPSLYPHLHLRYAARDASEKLDLLKEELKGKLQIIVGQPQLKLHLLPIKRSGEVDFSATPSGNSGRHSDDFIREEVEDFIKESAARGVPDLRSEVNELKNKILQTFSPFHFETAEGKERDRSQQLHANADVRLSFLGTGCSVPSKYRNVSGICLELESEVEPRFVLLDAGEGSWSQLRRLRQVACSSTAPSVSHGIDAIWISHPHADHHMGLVKIIAEKHLLAAQSGQCAEDTSDEKVVVIAPPAVLAFLDEFCQNVDNDLCSAYEPISCRQFDPEDPCDTLDVYWRILWERAKSAESGDHFNSPSLKRQRTCGETTISNRQMTEGQYRNFKQVFAETLAEPLRMTLESKLASARRCLRRLGVVGLSNHTVIHCGQSYGVRLDINRVKCSDTDTGGCSKDFSNHVNIDLSRQDDQDHSGCTGFSIVYSGDTRPCERLIEAGRNATILIHEATFEDDKIEEAVQKRHSTIGESIDVARHMNAYRLILTHFSQRYPGVPQYELSFPLDTTARTTTSNINLLEGDTGNVFSAPSVLEHSSDLMFTPILACDYLCFSLKDLLWAPISTKLLNVAFPPTDEEAENEDGLGNGL